VSSRRSSTAFAGSVPSEKKQKMKININTRVPRTGTENQKEPTAHEPGKSHQSDLPIGLKTLSKI
jgi:hypothetical protein